MPRGDKSGPEGMGPMTGRRLGPCAGFGRGRGFGRGYRWHAVAPDGPFATQITGERTVLAAEVVSLKSQLAALEAKLSELLEKD